MKTLTKNIIYFIFCFISLPGFAQKFEKIYTGLGVPNNGANVLAIDSERTIVAGNYRTKGTSPFICIVDSTGNKEYNNSNFLYTQPADYVSNLTQTSNGYAFFQFAGTWSNSGNNNLIVMFDDTLHTVESYIYSGGGYDYSSDINLYYVLNKGLFFTCTVWDRGFFNSNLYCATFISNFDSTGKLLWNNSFGPSDSAYPCQVFNSIITSDSGLAVMGIIYDTLHLKKYDLKGNLLFDHKDSFLIYNPVAIINSNYHGLPYNLYGELIEVNKNILSFGNAIDATTHKYQLALEILDLNNSLVAKKKYILYNDTANITPKAVYATPGNTAILNYSIAGSTLNYYLIVGYKGDSVGSFTLPAYTVSVYDNGNILCALDSNKSIIVREFTPLGKVVYKYAYQPFDSLNVCYDIKPLTYPGRFVLTGSSNNNLLIIRQDTGVNASVNNLQAVEGNIKLFPNPTTNSLTISFNQSFNGSVAISNVLGQEVYSNPNIEMETGGNSVNIDVSGLKSGVYIISFRSGEAIVRKKFIKI